MSKIQRFDRPAVRTVRDAMEEALKKVSEEFGVAVTIGNASFTDNNVTFKVSAAVVDADGSAKTREAESFERLATMWGFEPSDLGRVFADRGRRYTIVGAKPTSQKYPILCRRDDGKVFKYPVPVVLRHLGRSMTSSMYAF